MHCGAGASWRVAHQRKSVSAVLPDTAQNAQTPLRTLESLTRADIRDAVPDARNLESKGNGAPAEPLKLVVCLEVPWHIHVALQLRNKANFLPFKNASRSRSKLASRAPEKIRTVHGNNPAPSQHIAWTSSTSMSLSPGPHHFNIGMVSLHFLVGGRWKESCITLRAPHRVGTCVAILKWGGRRGDRMSCQMSRSGRAVVEVVQDYFHAQKTNL